MAVEYTFHTPVATADLNNVDGLVALGRQTGDVTTVADGAASAAFSVSGLLCVYATSNSRVRVGDVTNGNGGMRLYADDSVILAVAAGDKLGVAVMA